MALVASKEIGVVRLGIMLVYAAFAVSVAAQSESGAAMPPSTAADSAEVLTLSKAVEIALARNPIVRIAAGGRELADAQLSTARASRLPLIQASETVTRSNNPVFVFGSLLEQGRFGPDNFLIDPLNNPAGLTNFRTGLSIRFPLFDQRQSAARIDLARIDQNQADLKVELVAQQIRFEVLKSYYGVLLAQARVVVADEAIRIGVADHKRIRDRFETGLIVRSDLLAAEVQLSEFIQQRIQSVGDLATAQAALNTALGIPMNTPHTITDQLIDRLFSIESQDELIRYALQQRPEYAQAALAVRSRARQVRAVRDEALPRVDAFANLGASGQSPVTGSSDYALGAAVTINVFDAGRKARMNQARALEAIAAAEQEQIGNMISFEVVRAYHQFISARERLQVVSQTTAQASEALRIVQERYRGGLSNITEMLRAEMALVRARTDAVMARHDHLLNYANVLLVTGRLKSVDAFVN